MSNVKNLYTSIYLIHPPHMYIIKHPMLLKLKFLGWNVHNLFMSCSWKLHKQGKEKANKREKKKLKEENEKKMAVGKKKKIVKLFINIARKQQLGDGIKCYKHLLHSTYIYTVCRRKAYPMNRVR